MCLPCYCVPSCIPASQASLPPPALSRSGIAGVASLWASGRGLLAGTYMVGFKFEVAMVSLVCDMTNLELPTIRLPPNWSARRRPPTFHLRVCCSPMN